MKHLLILFVVIAMVMTVSYVDAASILGSSHDMSFTTGATRKLEAGDVADLTDEPRSYKSDKKNIKEYYFLYR